MERKDEEIKRLRDLVKIQNQEVDMRVNQKFHKKLSKKEQTIINLNQKNEKQSERMLSLFDKIQNLTKKINKNRGIPLVFRLNFF